MKLIANWRAVLKHAASVRLIIVAALLSGAEVALPFLDGALPVSEGIFAALAFLTTAAALVARLVAQQRLSAPADEPVWEDGEPK